jgi:histidyl-tRNA synthetase
VAECREAVREAPVILDSVCDGCREHFEKVKALLASIGVPFRVNPRMVRGLDYYKKTAFEVIGHSLGAQNAVAGGGRYDGLVRDLGGPDIPGIGFAIGFERLVSMLPGKDEDYSPAPDLFVATLGREADDAAFRLLNGLRGKGLRVETDYSGKSLKAQMKRANRSGASHVLIIGGEELAEGALVLRDMKNGVQEKMPIPDAIARIEEIFHVR